MSSIEELTKAFEDFKADTEKRLAALEGSKRPASRAGAARRASGNVTSPVKKTTKTRPATSAGRTKAKVPKAASSSSIKDDTDDLDPARKSLYNVGKRKIVVVAPAEFKSDNSAPSQSLKLEYTYGYNGKAGRNNLYFADEKADGVVYSIAAAGVHMQLSSKQQNHFTGHTEDIMSLAKHPSRSICATGQLDPKGAGTPYISVWDYESDMKEVRLAEFHDRAVIGLAFGLGGKYLISIGMDNDHTAALWDWENNTKKPLFSSTVFKNVPHGVIVDPASTEDNVTFVVYGEKGAKTMNYRKEKGKWTSSSNNLSYYSTTKIVEKALVAGAFIGGKCVLGGQSGLLYVFTGKELSAHKQVSDRGAVGGVTRGSTDSEIITGSSDGQITKFTMADDGKLTEAGKWTFHEVKGKEKRSVKSLDYSAAADLVLVGTVKNEVLTVNLSNGEVKTHMDGHTNEMWALAVHPSEPLFASGSNDGDIRIWNYEAREQQQLVNVETAKKDEVHSAAFNPDGTLLAVGTKAGYVVVYSFPGMEVKHSKRHRKEQIDAINFSPNGQVIGLGSWDQMGELIDVESFSSITLKGHTSSITHVNFTVDSKFFVTNSRDYEILYWNCETGKRVGASAIADAQWHDWQCVLGWPVQGVFREGFDGTDVNAVNISGDDQSDNRLVAFGDDFGHVSILRYPSLAKDSGIKEYPGHSSHVTNVRFTASDDKIISLGGNDMGIFQWAVV